jgi:hypothetical protein
MEPPVYRPFALLAYATTLAVGTPLGIGLLAWLYLGGPALSVDLMRLHAHTQVFGFFATLIPGVAPHLLARFTGRPLAPDRRQTGLAAALAGALALRLVSAAGELSVVALAAALIQALVFIHFGIFVWRTLDLPPLAPLRYHLTLATAWLASACVVEAGLRGQALTSGLSVLAVSGLRAVPALGLLGGVVGWVLGVLLRAGPMFVADWRIPRALVPAVPALLAGAAGLAAAGEMLPPVWGQTVARAADLLALGTIVAVVAAGGTFRRPVPSLPMLSRSPAEARLFRLAAGSAVAGLAGAALGLALAAAGRPDHLIADAVRHLLTVGVLTTIVLAMTFRLIPVLEGRPLPWPAARTLTFWLLLGAVILRSAEVLVGLGWRAIALGVALSGPLVWLAIAAAAGNLVAALVRAPRPDDRRRGRPRIAR